MGFAAFGSLGFHPGDARITERASARSADLAIPTKAISTFLTSGKYVAVSKVAIAMMPSSSSAAGELDTRIHPPKWLPLSSNGAVTAA